MSDTPQPGRWSDEYADAVSALQDAVAPRPPRVRILSRRRPGGRVRRPRNRRH